MALIKNSTDIVFILPPRRFKEHRYSLGVMYLSGYLRDHGYDNTILESKILGGRDYVYDRQKARQEIIETTVRLNPKVVAFTSTTIEISEVLWLNREIRKQINACSVIGGPHVTATPDEVLHSGFDIAVIGEGELTVLELVKELAKDVPNLSGVNGIAWREKNSDRVFTNPPRELMDISDLSLPAYDKVNMDYHTRVWDDVIRGIPIRSVMVMGSRGCPYGCTFCACNKVFGRRVRYRSIDNIKREIILLKEKYGVEGIWFADDTLTVDYDYVKKICALMRELKMFWGAQSRVDLTKEGIVKEMRRSGCLQLDFGIESGSQHVLDDIINKRIKLSDVEEAFRLCKKYGIRTEASFMVGLPTETREEMEATFEFAQKIKSDHYSFSIFTPLPGTKLYEDYFQDKLTLADFEEISFHHTEEKFNRSKVATAELERLFSQWRKKLFEGVKSRGLANSFRIFQVWAVLGNKRERAGFISFKLFRAVRYYLNKLGFNFSID